MKTYHLKSQLQRMNAGKRIKAFITDMFMINMPLLYITTYIFLDGKEEFTHNHFAILACGLMYGVIISLFLSISTQTPGYRYVGLKLVRENDNTNISFALAFVRYVLWIVGTSFVFGIALGFFRKDGKCLHDVVCKTCVKSI